MSVTKLNEHEFFKTTSLICSKYISRCDSDESKLQPKPTREEFYAIETQMSALSIIECIDQLHFSIEMLSGYRSQSTPKGMNRHDYIVFGVENFFLRLTSIYDRCLRLVNIIFQLGLPDKECKESTIIKNLFIKNTPVAKALKKLDKFTTLFRYQRNLIAHKSNYSDKELTELNAYYYAVERDHEFKKKHHMYKQDADHYIADKKAEFKKSVVELEYLVEEVFNAVHSAFKNRLQTYR